MSCTAVALAANPPARTHSLSPRAGFFLLASITTSFLAGSSAPTPLYRSTSDSGTSRPLP